ncbi:glucose 1-dehydrogenase [Streptomyces sp. SID13031]|uniref:SDR family NAD(P)-dependent oxidoreductase n=1 Tax=Streptomyces sp. SID13031 TaxID=2706046 RepID=UPI0013C9B12B|nr:glucose 1-dehydrogenase [Streptomyces sp. SID13031]NEA34976.1 glucose 1-dehydrogenase [Streptomyces sp. SID13031]
MDGNQLGGKTIMITGASSGIGAAAARCFAADGAAVVLMARRKEKLEEIAAEIRAAGGRAELAPGDVTDPEAVERAVATAVSAFGRLDGAFNNAGWGSIGPLLHETDDAVYEQIMDVNVRGVWNCLKYQLPVMMAQGSGSVVNTSSTAGAFATGALAPYVAAKHAVLGLTRAAAAEYGSHGIRINALMVGSTRTELMEAAIRAVPQLEQAASARAIQPRLAEPIEVARAAAWLLSDQASFITGGAVPVDGGASAI